jgi:hypothetical protein
MTTHNGLPRYQLGKATSFLNNVDVETIERYLVYWNTLKPKNHQEYYLRWIFAFMSIHTSWKANVVGFLAVTSLPQNFNWQQLYWAIKRARCGLTKMRTVAIWDFHRRFWHDPTFWYPRENESMPDCRDRLAKATYGIGLTKTSFVLEMAYPKDCSVVCLDTHILQLYDYYRKDTPNAAIYRAMERHWIETCEKKGVPSPMVRHIYWDGVQGFEDTRYWSYVLEEAHGLSESCQRREQAA